LPKREANLIAIIDDKLPEFAKACRDSAPAVILHQDAFAADYQEEEYRLLGMAIKFADIFGRDVHITGNNRGTLEPNEAIN
jgi:hypothetical protein